MFSAGWLGVSRRSQVIDRPGLFACGLVPALLTLLIRAWVDGQAQEARRSLAWALQVSPASLPLPKLDEAATRQTAADLGEQPVLHPIAGRADRHNLDRSVRGEVGVSRNQTIADEGGLAQRHRAAAGPNAEMAGRH